jgi:hypothetical protein
MAGLTDFSDEPFCGYVFAGAPERQPRLWFLDRQLYTLVVWGSLCAARDDMGRDNAGHWTTDIYAAAWNFADQAGQNPDRMREMRRDLSRFEQVCTAMPGLPVHYEHHDPAWTAVWRLTDTVIPHVHTFGQDDTWRLGVWPD